MFYEKLKQADAGISALSGATGGRSLRIWVSGFLTSPRLSVAEVFDAIQVDGDQVAFGVEREFNFRHEAGPSAVLLPEPPVALL